MNTTLIAVSGMSPAIITETVWALAHSKPAVIPRDVIVITTTKGARDIEEMLLTPLEGWGGKTVWESLRKKLCTTPALKFHGGHLQLSIRVIDLPDGKTGVRRMADDIRSGNDNMEAADFILRQVGEACRPVDNHVIASIAGGRKTMGALLYTAMSLLGRDSDRVTHVLVNEPFENCRGFFYGGQPVRDLEARPFGQPPVMVKATDARIELADIPFVPLRYGFAEMNEPNRTFRGLIERYAKELSKRNPERPVVGLDSDRSGLVVNGVFVKLGAPAFRVAAFLHGIGGKHFPGNMEALGPFADFCMKRFGLHLDERALTKGLSDIRTALKREKLGGMVDYLVRENHKGGRKHRVGFDAEII